MTDEQIIKALECCIDEMGCTKGCPCFDPKAKGSHCTVSKKLELEKLTLDLIKRQKAEIERYEREHNSKFEKWKLLDERTKKRYAELYEEAKDIVRAEAIKEFAERLRKKEKTYNADGFYQIKFIPRKEIDNLVKEMVGDIK